MKTVLLTKEQIKQIVKDQILRINLANESIGYFFAIYLPHHFDMELASFHYDFFKIAENDRTPLAIIQAFRGSGKSTIFSLCYVLWAIMGKQKKRFILILTGNQTQAKQYMKNLIRELENNETLKADIGPFTEENSEMSTSTLVIKKFDARITVASVEQNIRGIKHGNTRPEVTILDDVENLESMQTVEGRDKLFYWYTHDIVPLGLLRKRIIIVGTQLHPDDLIGRLATRILEKKQKGIVRKIPIISPSGQIAWKGKYPDRKAIEEEKQNIASDRAWESEYMLNPQAAITAIIKPEWIHYYDELLSNYHLLATATGTDFAGKAKETSDFSSMVTAKAYKVERKPYIYILPYPINKHLSFPEIVDQIRLLNTSLGGSNSSKFYVEDTTFQPAVTDNLRNEGIIIENVNTTVSKGDRLRAISAWIRDGKILFPRNGCEELIKQILYFGTYRYDDLMDAFTLVCIKLMEELNRPEPNVTIFTFDNPRRGLSTMNNW